MNCCPYNNIGYDIKIYFNKTTNLKIMCRTEELPINKYSTKNLIISKIINTESTLIGHT